MNETDAKAYVMQNVALEDITDRCAGCGHLFTKGICEKVVPFHAPDFFICPQCELGLAS